MRPTDTHLPSTRFSNAHFPSVSHSHFQTHPAARRRRVGRVALFGGDAPAPPAGGTLHLQARGQKRHKADAARDLLLRLKRGEHSRLGARRAGEGLRTLPHPRHASGTPVAFQRALRLGASALYRGPQRRRHLADRRRPALCSGKGVHQLPFHRPTHRRENRRPDTLSLSGTERHLRHGRGAAQQHPGLRPERHATPR